MSSSMKPGEQVFLDFTQPVPDEIRDQVFASIRHINNNNVAYNNKSDLPRLLKEKSKVDLHPSGHPFVHRLRRET